MLWLLVRIVVVVLESLCQKLGCFPFLPAATTGPLELSASASVFVVGLAALFVVLDAHVAREDLLLANLGVGRRHLFAAALAAPCTLEIVAQILL